MPGPQQQIPKVIRQLESVAEQVIKKIAFDVTANLVRAPSEGGTPVDTGWARANWIVNIGSALILPVGSPEAVPAAGITAGVVASYKLFQGPVYISNNVPYISRLNRGHSQQAPAGFVQAAIRKAVRDVVTVKVVTAA